MALHLMTPVPKQVVKLAFSFDTFGNHRQAHSFRNCDNGERNCRILCAMSDVGDKSAINLHIVEWQAL